MALVSLEDVPLADLRPYDVYQLQSEFHCYSPREAYLELCHRAQCHPSKTVAAMLPSIVGAWDKVQSLDLSRTYVGPKGVIPVIELCKRLPSLRRLNLSGNYLQNDSVWCIAQLVTYHPSVAELDISHNEFVSWSGAMCLATAVVQNTRLTFVNLLKTSVEPAAAEAVFYHTRKNAVAMAIARGRTMPNPTSHPTAIHLRAMRRYFDQIKDPATGCVTRDGLVDGYRERLHTLGRSGELERCKQTLLDELRARAPSDAVTWEAFLVLVMLDAAEYVAGFVDALRQVFVEFNVNAAVGSSDPVRRHVSSPAPADNVTSEDAVFADGFVEVEAFPAVHVRLFGEVLCNKDMEALRASMGLENDGTTVNWDAFLYTWYHKCPTKGAKPYRSNVTRMPRSIRPLPS